jgi:2-hydroxychromene-2-carboxylate isomerase
MGPHEEYGVKRHPRIYFSFRSPYSWLAVHRLRAVAPDVCAELDWIPYFDPDTTTAEMLHDQDAAFHYVQVSRPKHRYILMDTLRLAGQVGVPMAWPIDRDPWWDLPHLAWLMARRLGRADAFYDQVTAARWGRGEDVCHPDVIREVAVRAGVDPELAVRAPDDPEIRAEGVAGLVSAYDDDVFGVPYIRLGQQRFWGYDRLHAFLDAWYDIHGGRPRTDAGTGPNLGGDTRPAAWREMWDDVSLGYDTDTGGGSG